MRPRFRLSVLMVVIGMCCCMLSGYSWRVRCIKSERLAEQKALNDLRCGWWCNYGDVDTLLYNLGAVSSRDILRVGLLQFKGELSVDGCFPVYDRDLENVAKLQYLTTLGLESTKVTDKGIVWLTQLKKLRLLILANTEVTEAGIQRLLKALPKCTIYDTNRTRRGPAPPPRF